MQSAAFATASEAVLPTGRETRSLSIAVNRRAIMAVLLWATALRFFHLGYESLWFDEIRMVIQGSGSLQNTLHLIGQKVQHPPAFHLLLNLFNRPIGTSDFAVRLLPAFLGIATVAVTYALGRAVAGRRTGLLAAALLATLPYHVKYSQEARMYMALCFLAAAAICLLLAVTRQRVTPCPRRLWAGWVVVNVLLLYTHYYGAFILAAEGLVVLWWMARDRRQRSLWKPWAASGGLVAASFLLWVPTMLRQPQATSPLPYGHAYGMALPVLTVGRFFVGKPFHTWALGLAVLVLLATAINGWISYSQNSAHARPTGRPPRLPTSGVDENGDSVPDPPQPPSPLLPPKSEGEGGVGAHRDAPLLPSPWRGGAGGGVVFFQNRSKDLEALVILAFFPIAAAWAVSFWRPIFLPRGLIGSMPPLAVLLGFALAQPWRFGGRWTRIGAVLALVIVLADGLHTYYTAPQKDRWRETAATVSANRQPGDLIWVADLYTEQGFDYYFSGEKRNVAPPGAYALGLKTDAGTLADLLEGHDRLWLVRTEEGEEFERYLRYGYDRAHLLQAWDFPAEMTSIHLRLFDVLGD